MKLKQVVNINVELETTEDRKQYYLMYCINLFTMFYISICITDYNAKFLNRNDEI